MTKVAFFECACALKHVTAFESEFYVRIYGKFGKRINLVLEL